MCTFTIPFSATADELVERATAAIQKAGGTFTGNVTSGKFNVPTPIGDIAGNYEIKAQEAIFNVTDKPFFVSCGMIEERLGAMFSNKTV